MRIFVSATLLALLVTSTLANTCCGPNLFLDRSNLYRRNPTQLANFIIEAIFKKIDCRNSQIPNGSDGNNIGLSVNEGCARIAQTIKWLRDCPNPLKKNTSGQLLSPLPAPNSIASLNSLILPGAANQAANIESYINQQSCTDPSQMADAHKTATGGTKGCKHDMKYDLGTVKSSFEHTRYQILQANQVMTHTGGTPSTAGLSNRL